MSYPGAKAVYVLAWQFRKQRTGELDWKAIGGTWGTATSKLSSWNNDRKIPKKS